MADQYWIDVLHPRPRVSSIGACDYEIMPDATVGKQYSAQGSVNAGGRKYAGSASFEVGGPWHHRPHGRYWQQPIYYMPDYGYVPVTATEFSEQDDIPDGVFGNYDVRAAWYNGARDALKEYQHARGRKPSAEVMRLMAEQIAQMKGGIARSEELTFVHHNLVLSYIISHDRLPSGYPSNDRGENQKLVQQATEIVQSHVNAYESSHRGFFGDIVHAVNSVADVALAPARLVEAGLSAIPVIGDPIHKLLALDPGKALGGIASNVARGERLDHAFLEAGKRELQAVKEVAPYVSKIMAFVPGVGTGVAAAIAAGTALAEGRSITDAVLDGIVNAVPGGALGKTAASAVLSVVHGNSLSSVALDAVKSQLPPAVQQAVNTAVAAAGGKNVREAVLQAIRANLPADAKKAVDIAVAVGTARNAQSAVIHELSKPAVLSKLSTRRVPPRIKEYEPRDSGAAKGFRIAIALFQHRGVTPIAFMAARSKLTPLEAAGFDRAVKTIKNLANPQMTSLVRGGIITRGHWRPVAANAKGAVPGRLIRGSKIVHGHYSRV